MKKYLRLLAAAALMVSSLAFTACNDEEEVKPREENQGRGIAMVADGI